MITKFEATNEQVWEAMNCDVPRYWNYFPNATKTRDEWSLEFPLLDRPGLSMLVWGGCCVLITLGIVTLRGSLFGSSSNAELWFGVICSGGAGLLLTIMGIWRFLIQWRLVVRAGRLLEVTRTHSFSHSQTVFSEAVEWFVCDLVLHRHNGSEWRGACLVGVPKQRDRLVWIATGPHWQRMIQFASALGLSYQRLPNLVIKSTE